MNVLRALEGGVFGNQQSRESEESSETVTTTAVVDITEKIDDPVRMYLTQMGEIPLLTRDQEIRLAKLITRNRRELAVMESLDSGKTIFDCETVDLPETVNCLTWHAEAIDKIYDQVSPPSDDHIAMILREPVGVVGLVLPWNFPLLMLAWKIAPALAAGCSVVVKPAEETSLTALRVAGLAAEAGLPRGVLNVVPGSGAEVGEPIGRHMDIDMVSFTGSTKVGKAIVSASAGNLKKVALELGGKNPNIHDVQLIDYELNYTT